MKKTAKLVLGFSGPRPVTVVAMYKQGGKPYAISEMAITGVGDQLTGIYYDVTEVKGEEGVHTYLLEENKVASEVFDKALKEAANGGL